MNFRNLVPLVLLASGLFAGSASAQEDEPAVFFRISVGPTYEASFDIGGALANAFTNPNRIEECETGDECGAPGVVGLAMASKGSLASLEQLFSGKADAAFVSKYLVLEEAVKREIEGGRSSSLRQIAQLYPESIHLIVPADSNIWKIDHLEKQRVGIGSRESGYHTFSKPLLEAYGFTEDNAIFLEVDGITAANMMLSDELDAFFHLATTPSRLVSVLSRNRPIRLLELAGPETQGIIQSRSFEESSLAGSVYENVPAVKTLSIDKMFVTSSKVPKDLITKITTALWSQRSSLVLSNIHESAGEISIDNQEQRALLPWHIGASFYYAVTRRKMKKDNENEEKNH